MMENFVMDMIKINSTLSFSKFVSTYAMLPQLYASVKFLLQEIYEQTAKLDASDGDRLLEAVQTSESETGGEEPDADDSERCGTRQILIPSHCTKIVERIHQSASVFLRCPDRKSVV